MQTECLAPNNYFGSQDPNPLIYVGVDTDSSVCMVLPLLDVAVNAVPHGDDQPTSLHLDFYAEYAFEELSAASAAADALSRREAVLFKKKLRAFARKGCAEFERLTHLLNRSWHLDAILLPMLNQNGATCSMDEKILTTLESRIDAALKSGEIRKFIVLFIYCHYFPASDIYAFFLFFSISSFVCGAE